LQVINNLQHLHDLAAIYHLYKQRKNVDPSPTSWASLIILLFYTITYCLPMTLVNKSYH